MKLCSSSLEGKGVHCKMNHNRLRYPGRILWLGFVIFYVLAVSGCATFRPKPMEEIHFFERAQTKSDGNMRVTVAVPSAKESKALFGVDLANDGIQPVWIRIENNEDTPYFFATHSLEPYYFSAAEAAYKSRFWFSGSANKKMATYFEIMNVPTFIEPGAEVSGFAFVSLDLGIKEVNVTLYGAKQIKWFFFLVPVPGVKADYHEVDLESLYSEEEIVSYDEAGLRAALENIPCCTTNRNGTGEGDPLNMVLIGDVEDVVGTLIRSGWDDTEPLYGGALWRTIKAFFLGKRYRHSSISSLYVFGRPQDAAFQKARETIHERNHLRLWLSPMRYKGKPVWIGQISRDIGIRFTWKTWNLMTHKIDPDVDETRSYLITDLIYSDAVEKLGFVSGVGSASLSEPRENLTGDPHFTDGLRAVLIVSHIPVPYSEVQLLNWEFPPMVEQYKEEWLQRNN